MANDPKENCYVARLLNEILNDRSNYLYLLILEPILLEINGVNLSFQKENVDESCAYKGLEKLILPLAYKVLRPECLTNDLKKCINA